MATVKLYQVPFSKDKNFIVDSIDAVLNSYEDSLFIYSDFPYVKVGLRTEIDIKLYDTSISTFNKNYCSVINDDNFEYYFYITDFAWRSQNTLHLYLEMDTVNTFSDNFSEMSDFSDRSFIEREHRNRFDSLGDFKVDKKSEDIIIDKKVIRDSRREIDNTLPDIHGFILFRKAYTTDDILYTMGGSTEPGVEVDDIIFGIIPLSNSNIIYRPYPDDIMHDITIPSFTIDMFKKTDPKLIDAVFVPYPFFSLFRMSTGVYSSDSSTVNALSSYVRDGLQCLAVLEKKVTRTFTSFFNFLVSGEVIDNNLNIMDIYGDDSINKAQWLETKLFHSDFYKGVLSYRGNPINFNSEDIGKPTFNLSFDFYVSRNLDGFLFDASANNSGNTSDSNPYKVYIPQKNSVTLYNSSYLEYMRNGYNYDKKAAQRQLIFSGITAGIGVASAVATGGATVPFLIGASAANLTNSAITSYENIERKKTEYENKGISLSNMSDYELQNEIATYAVYEELSIDENIKESIYNMLFFTGYKTDAFKRPNPKSRRRFNYVKGNIVLNHEENIPYQYLRDIKEKFQQGVTYIHNPSDENLDYDFDQNYENWETTL